MQGEVAGDFCGFLAGFFNVGALEGGRWVFVHVQEIIPAQVFVTFSVVGVYTGGLDGGVYLAVLRVFCIDGEIASEIIELTIQPAVTQVGNLEHDKLVGAFGVELVGATGLVGERHVAEQQRQGGDRDFFQ